MSILYNLIYLSVYSDTDILYYKSMIHYHFFIRKKKNYFPWDKITQAMVELSIVYNT